MPPWVGKGCTQIIVASGFSGVASSPTRERPSEVVSFIGMRVAGKTELADIAGISVTLARACRERPNRAYANVDVHRPPREYPKATPQRGGSQVESPDHTRDIDMSSLPRILSACARSSHHQGVTPPGWNFQRAGELVVRYAGSCVPWNIELPLSANSSKTPTYLTS